MGYIFSSLLSVFAADRPGVLYREQILTAVDAIVSIIESPYNLGLVLGSLQFGKQQLRWRSNSPDPQFIWASLDSRPCSTRALVTHRRGQPATESHTKAVADLGEFDRALAIA